MQQLEKLMLVKTYSQKSVSHGKHIICLTSAHPLLRGKCYKISTLFLYRKKNICKEIVLYQPNEQMSLEVKLENETVWLNRQQIAMLFGTQRQAITKHLKNIFESGELERQATCSILELVQKEGNRKVIRQVESIINPLKIAKRAS